MTSPDQHQQYLDTLTRLGGSAGNVKLREALGWDQATYDSVQSELKVQGKIVPGRGRGGSVTLVGINGAEPEPLPTATEEEKDRFLHALGKLGGSTGNVSLRSALGWEEETYFRVQKALVNEGKVSTGRGRGGSVQVANKTASKESAPSLFDNWENEGNQQTPNTPILRSRPVETDEEIQEDSAPDHPVGDLDSNPMEPEEEEASPEPAFGGYEESGSGRGNLGFVQVFKNIDNMLRNEGGCTTELDYTEQTSWLLFLKYLDGLEQDKEMEAELEGRKYTPILETTYRWETWAAPKGPDGQIDHNRALSGDDLRDFVNLKLFPYLQSFKIKAGGSNTIEYKIGEIFGEIKNKIQNGYNLREIIDEIDHLRFRSQEEKHELSHLYEVKIKNMGNAGRNGGEYYTPRPLIRAMIQVIQPKLGETIYDGAVGSAGFLCEAFDYLKATYPERTTAQEQFLQQSTFFGQEKKSLAYVIAIMNMILHGIEAPNILHTNTLSENLADIQEKDRVDIILANPPFGGGERNEVQQNFPIKSSETAYLFLQHFIKKLKAGGRAAVVIKNTFLSNSDYASIYLRKFLIEICNLHTVLDCPGGTFQGAGVKTVVLFFEKGSPTRHIWYYQLEPGRKLGKTIPLHDDDLIDFLRLQKTYANSPKSWSVDVSTIDLNTFDLSGKNPITFEEITHRNPTCILEEIASLEIQTAEILNKIKVFL